MGRRTWMVQIIRPTYGESLVASKKIGRNSSCVCGSGKKAKHCCGCETEYYSKKVK